MADSISVFARVDVSDVLDELEDADLINELKRRQVDTAADVERSKTQSLMPLLEEALEMLQQGRADDARLTLERALYPKWKSAEEAFGELRSRMSAHG